MDQIQKLKKLENLQATLILKRLTSLLMVVVIRSSTQELDLIFSIQHQKLQMKIKISITEMTCGIMYGSTGG
jgi:hypothetical protein